MALSSPGIGSNLDINGIVSQLMSVEQKPLIALAKKEASYQAKLSGFGTLKSALSQFQTAIQGLSTIGKFQATRATPGDTSIVTATATGAASAGTHTIDVTKLAQAQKLVAAGQASDSTAIGGNTTTTVSFDFGTITGGSFDSTTGHYTGSSFTSSGKGAKSITIDSTNNSLTGIRDAINKANLGVTATIVNDGSASPYRLALTVNATGKESSLKISVSGDSTISTLLSHNPADNLGQALTETATAQNAEFKVDGIAVTKPTNTSTDVIEGLTLTVAKAGSTSVSVSRDTSSVASAINAFVKAYNDINQNLTDAAAYNATTKQAAILNGESAVRTIQTQLRSVLSAPIAGGATAFTLLSQVGVTIQKNGSLAVDDAKLQTALTNNFNDIAGLFAPVGKTSDSLVIFNGAAPSTVPGAYAVNITSLATQANLTGSSAAANPGHGSTTGSAAAGLNITTGVNDTLQVQIDGVSNTVTLAQNTYADANALVTEVQSKIDATFGTGKATVTQSNGVLTITSASGGVTSSASVTGGNGSTNLLGASPTVVAGSETSITTGVNDSLQVQLNGVTATVKLAAGNYSFAGLATEIQAKINGQAEFVAAHATVAVTESSGKLTVTSNMYGSASTIAITGAGAADLFGATPSSTPGKDVAGSINGATATGSGQILTAAGSDASQGLSIKVTGGSTGARGTINYSQGYASQFDELLTSLLGSTGPLASRTDGINSSLKLLAKEKNRLTGSLAETEKRYRAQFTALDVAISSMSKTSAFLTQQLANLPKME